MDNILVSVHVITFNHENFIEKAILGAIEQSCNFKFEVIIGDDASSDNTPEVIKRYHEKYPDLIIPLLSKKNKGAFENHRQIFAASRGKYIALCEGDDYWDDPQKLQKQVDFLEANPDYGSCYHSVRMVDAVGRLISKNRWGAYKSFTKEEMISGEGELMTLTAMFKNNIKFIEGHEKVASGDTVLWHTIGFLGHAKYIEDIKPATYRVHQGGLWSSKNGYERLLQGIKTYELIMSNLRFTGNSVTYVESLLVEMIDKYMIEQLAGLRIINYFKGIQLFFQFSFLNRFLFLKKHASSLFKKLYRVKKK